MCENSAMKRLRGAMDELGGVCKQWSNRSTVSFDQNSSNKYCTTPILSLCDVAGRDSSEFLIEKHLPSVLPRLVKLCDLILSNGETSETETAVDSHVDRGSGFMRECVCDIVGVCAGDPAAASLALDEVLASKEKLVDDMCIFLLTVPERVANMLHGISAVPQTLHLDDFSLLVCRSVLSPSFLVTRQSSTNDATASRYFVLRRLIVRMVRRGHNEQVASCIAALLSAGATGHAVALLCCIPGSVLSNVLFRLLGVHATMNPSLLPKILSVVDEIVFSRSTGEGETLLRHREAARPSWLHEVFTVQLLAKRHDRRVVRGLVDLLFPPNVRSNNKDEEEKDTAVGSNAELRLQAMRTTTWTVFRAWSVARTVQFGDDAINRQLANAVMYILCRRDPAFLTSNEDDPRGNNNDILEMNEEDSGEPSSYSSSTLVGMLLSGISMRMASPVRELQKLAALVAAKFSSIMAKHTAAVELEELHFDAFPNVLEDWSQFDSGGVSSSAKLQSASSEQSPRQQQQRDATASRRVKRTHQQVSRATELDPDEILIPGERADEPVGESPEVDTQSRTGYSKLGIVLPAKVSVDDELRPFGVIDTLAADEAIAEKRKSILYLNEAVRGLTTSAPGSGAEDHSDDALLALPVLLSRSSDDDVSLVSSQLFHALLSTPCAVRTDGLAEARFESLVLLTVKAPLQVLNVISTALFSHNYTMTMRITLMKVLAEAAARLSSIEISTQINQPRSSPTMRKEKRVYPPIPTGSELRNEAAASIINVRVESKTRRWGAALHGSSTARRYHNKLADYGGLFIAALTQRFDSGHYKLLQDEVFVGVQLLRTVLTIVKGLTLAKHALFPLAPQIVEFVLALVRHKEPTVRAHCWYVLLEIFHVWHNAAWGEFVAVIHFVVAAAERASKDEDDHLARGCAMDVLSLLQSEISALLPLPSISSPQVL